MSRSGLINPFHVVFAALLIASVILTLCTQTRGHSWGDDFAAYIHQAESMADGTTREYVSTNRFAMFTSSPPAGPAAAPWGFPLLIAPVCALFGSDPPVLKRVLLVNFVLFLVSLWFGLRRRHTQAGRVLVVALFAVNPGFIAFMDHILSDIPFLFFSTLSVFLAQRVTGGGRRLLGPGPDRVLLGLVIAFAFFIRPNGLLVLIALGLVEGVGWFRASRKRTSRDGPNRIPWGLLVLPYVVFALAVVVWRLVLPDGGAPYTPEVTARTILSNLGRYARAPAELFSGAPGGMLIYLLSVPLAVVGMIRRRSRDSLALIYMAMTLAIYVYLPFSQGLRYIFPILPFYVSFAVTGLEAVGERLPGSRRKFMRSLALAPGVLVVALLAMGSVRAAAGNLQRGRATGSGPYTAASQEAFTFIRTQTERDATIVFFKPRAMRLLTGRLSIRMEEPAGLDWGDYFCFYAKAGSYEGQISAEEGAQLVRQGKLVLVYRNDEFQLFRIRGGWTPP